MTDASEQYQAEVFDCEWDLLWKYSQILTGQAKDPPVAAVTSANSVAAMVLSAFAFESFLNGALHTLFGEDSEHFTPLRYDAKLRLILGNKFTQLDFSKAPFQTLIAIFTFRNAQAHSKTLVVEGTYQPGNPEWEKLIQAEMRKARKIKPTEETAKKFSADVFDCIQIVEKLAGIEVRAKATYQRK